MISRRADKLLRRQHDEVMAAHEERREELRAHSEEARRSAEESKRRAEESRAAIARMDAALEEFREFNREILLRNEKVYTNVLVRLEELGRETRASTEQLRSNTAETRAQTKAVLSLLDRFGENGGAAAA